MRSVILIISLTIFCALLNGVNWEWAVSAGAGDLDRVWDMALDSQGNILVTGEFVDTLQIGNFVIEGWGLSDIFVAKFNPQGVPLWAQAFGGTDSDIGIGIDTDAQGNSYITGLYSATAHFETQTLVSAGSWDIFILKLDADGNRVWSYSEGSPEGDIGYGIAALPDGRCFVTGWFGGTLVCHDNSTLTSWGGSDIYTFACYTDGSFIWKRQAGSSGVEYGYKIDVDNAANVYVTGSATNGTDFSGTLMPVNGAYIVSYSYSGNLRWLNYVAGAGVNSIAVDRAPSLIEQFGCITGRFAGSAQFGDTTLNSVIESDDAYTAVFQLLTGSWINAHSAGGTGSDKGRACTYNVFPYYTGSFEGTANLFGTHTTSAGASDAYVLKTTLAGNDWLMTAGGVNNDTPVDIAADIAGNVFVCGWYSGFARFGNELSLYSGSETDLDMFIAKLNPALSPADDETTTPHPVLSCYPNPFSDKLIVRFTPESGLSKVNPCIGIYNIKGEKVGNLVLNKVETNTWQGEWDGFSAQGAKCPPGIYFLKSTGPARKVMLLQ